MVLVLGAHLLNSRPGLGSTNLKCCKKASGSSWEAILVSVTCGMVGYSHFWSACWLLVCSCKRLLSAAATRYNAQWQLILGLVETGEGLDSLTKWGGFHADV